MAPGNPWMKAHTPPGPEFVHELAAAGEGLDARFELLYPQGIREVSEIHWTPIRVVRRVVQLLRLEPGMRVLDVGSGPGKFCIVGALLSQASFVGVEQRANLVELARATATVVDATGASFLHGDAFELDWREFRCLYLYNPYEEQLFEAARRVDEALDFTEQRYRDSVHRTLAKLRGMPVGTRVALYHGFGGLMPPGYRRHFRGFYGTGTLELWERE